MITALFYLQWNLFRNRITSRLKRLKQPKYLFGAVVGALYIYFYFFRFLFANRSRNPAAGTFFTAPENQLLLELAGGAMLFIIVLLAWFFPADRAALRFTEAETAFLFPAPFSRQQLIQYKLIRSQLTIFFGALFFTLLTRRFGGNPLIHALGWWLILAVLDLHFIASSFARTLLLDRGISNRLRRALTLVLFAILGAFIWHWGRTTLPPITPADQEDPGAFMRYSQQLLTSGPLLYLLYPFRLLVRPFLATDATAFLIALAPVVLIFALHYFWVVFSGVAFEEASLEASQKYAARLAAARSGNWQALKKRTKAGRPWFKLGPTGFAPVALVWKNLLGVGQIFTARLMISIFTMVVVFGVAFSTSDHQRAISLTAAIIIGISLAYSLLLGPQILRLDFRADLPLADILKTFPLPGWQIALGQILAPVVVLAGLQWILILLGAGLVFFLPNPHTGLFLAIALGAAFLLPMLDGLLLIIPNAAALLFPAWVQAGRDGARGIEVMGQRLIFSIAQLLVLALALVPGALAFCAVFFPVRMALNPVIAIPPASLAAAVIVAVEAGIGVVLLGRFFEKFDVAEDPAA